MRKLMYYLVTHSAQLRYIVLDFFEMNTCLSTEWHRPITNKLQWSFISLIFCAFSPQFDKLFHTYLPFNFLFLQTNTKGTFISDLENQLRKKKQKKYSDLFITFSEFRTKLRIYCNHLDLCPSVCHSNFCDRTIRTYLL